MTLRLLHFSDIHFGGENVEALAAATAFARASPYDLIVVSGDITQFGSPPEFEAAGRWFAALSGPKLSTPGNHDTPWMGLVARLTRPFEGYEQAIGPVEDRFEASGMRVQALNSARGWQLRLNWSKGEVSGGQARQAAASLARSPAGAVRILVCHHPLVEPAGEPITARVRGGRAAARRFVEAGVDIILSGHLHAPFAQPLPFGDALTHAVGASTLSLRERGVPAGFNVIEIEDEAAGVTAMEWRDGALVVGRRWDLTLRPR